MASSQIVLYSCIVNKRDRPKIIEYRDDISYVLFTDDLGIKADGWDVRPILKKYDDPVRTSRFHKHNPFLLFPDAEYTVWLDATHWPHSSIMPILNGEMSMMRHFVRSTVKEELQACSDAKMDSVKTMTHQFRSYVEDGFKDDQGLYSTTCVVRKNTERVKEFSEFWWREICKWSRRDQLSLPYCLWKFPIDVSTIDGFCRTAPSPYFKMISHYKKTKKLLC